MGKIYGLDLPIPNGDVELFAFSCTKWSQIFKRVKGMKKFTLISATFLLAFAGCTCGQGWRPNILTNLHNHIYGVGNKGELCDAGCAPTAPAVEHDPNTGCSTCGNNVSAPYGSYDEQIISDGMVIGSNAPMTYATPSAGEPIRPQSNR
jgi:hypothetical protein